MCFEGWNRRSISVLVAGCAVALLVAGPSRAGEVAPNAAARAKAAAAGPLKGRVKAEPEQAGAKLEAAPDTVMAEMMKAAMPGPRHEWLKKGEGRWKATVKMFGGPGEPMVSEGVAENRMILGGRYLEERFTGSMMGQPFEGYGLTGFDNRKQQFWSFWVDNGSTGMMSLTGQLDSTGRTLTMQGVTDGPDGKPVNTRAVTKVVDDKTQVWSMYGIAGGQETLMMEITYTRAE